MEENMKFQNVGFTYKNDSQMMFLKWKFKLFAIVAFFYLRLQLSAWASQKGKFWAPKRLKHLHKIQGSRNPYEMKAVFNDKEFQKQRK